MRGGALDAVPIGTRLPLLRILLGGGDGSLWFSGMLATGIGGCVTSAGLCGLTISAGAMPVPPCTAEQMHQIIRWTSHTITDHTIINLVVLQLT